MKNNATACYASRKRLHLLMKAASIDFEAALIFKYGKNGFF